MARTIFWLLCIIATTVSAYVALPPSVDPFYQPPSGFESQQPGAILRSRKLPVSPYGINASIAATYQLLFRSTDSQQRPDAVVSTILVPPNADAGKLFSTQDAYDSAAIDCGPSYQLYLNNSQVGERAVMAMALQAGWYVSVPDFEGYLSAFTNGIQSGQATLDSLRAALNSSSITGLRSDARKVLVGGSGGALGSEWALELQSTYAPELKIDGSLLTSLTPNVTSVLQTVEGTLASGLIPLGVLGLTKQFIELAQWLSNNLVPSNSANFLKADQLCGEEFLSQFLAQQVSQTYFGRANAFLDAVPQSVIQKVGIMGLHGTPQSPIFAYKGVLDEVSPVADTDALIRKYCAAGARIQYQRATNAGHISAGTYGITAGWQFVKDRLNGIPAPAGCNITNVTQPGLFNGS